MKNIFLKVTGLFLASLLLVFVGCEKDDLKKLDDEMATWQSDGITSTTVELSGFVVAEGDGFAEYGVVYGLTENPTTSDNKAIATDVENAVYWVTITGLDHLTTYHYRAYAIDDDGSVLYGEDKTFSTIANIATVTVSEASGITDYLALLTGNVTYDGRSDVTAKGICYGIEANPTIASDTTLNGEGTGEYIATLDELLPATTYYARAYAINGMGTAYSNEVSFTTLIGLVRLSTGEVTNITKTTADISGNVSHNGGVDITERGFVYAMNEDPTVDDTKISDAENTTGDMTATISGLSSGKRYYVRAFATNSEGTAYGDNVQFTTESDITTWYLPGNYVAASYPIDGFSDWTPESSPFVRNTDDNPTTLEGYVYLANDNSEWKFATDNSWGTNYGDTDADGTLDAGGTNITSAAGYYKVNVDMSTTPMTYTAVATDWGVIGDATADAWNSDQNLTYYPATQTWRGAMHLTAAEIKFRANDGWDINYGLADGAEFLTAGASNIAIDVEADYDITLDLSNPNEYTYMANRWGVIGDATPGGWDEDTNMTWDATNEVFTVTVDLTAASFKFRANDAWSINYGGDLNALSQDGSNFSVAEAGNYTITLNTITMVATMTKN